MPLGCDRQLGKGPAGKVWAVGLAPQRNGKKSPLPHPSTDIPCEPSTRTTRSGLSWVAAYFLFLTLTFPTWCSAQLFWLRLWLSFLTTTRVASLGLGPHAEQFPWHRPRTNYLSQTPDPSLFSHMQILTVTLAPGFHLFLHILNPLQDPS